MELGDERVEGHVWVAQRLVGSSDPPEGSTREQLVAEIIHIATRCLSGKHPYPEYLRILAYMRKSGATGQPQVDEQSVELAVEVFMMLADPTRVRIVLALKDGELSVNTLADVVAKSPAAVSQHLAKLRLARIVATRREGTRVFYRLENEHAEQLVTDAIHQAEHTLGGRPPHHDAQES